MENDNNELATKLEQAVAMAKCERYSEALQLLDAMRLNNPLEATIWAKRAFVNECQGDHLTAVADWSQAIAICEEPHYFYMRGSDRFQLKQYREAISDFTKVIELCDLYNTDYYRGPAYFFRADSYLRLGEFHSAKSDCEHVRDDMQTWTDRLRSKADILWECD